ncbi:hypothetical protein DRN73_07770 [Candidatus Pacearchaeota archaeon]|nr:MAG: hypothetical protein DRN73_07770 [Candidatus Pacearchaeota archaeon]
MEKYGITPTDTLYDVFGQLFMNFPYRIFTSLFVKNKEERLLNVVTPLFIAIMEIGFYYGFLKEKYIHKIEG